jgi:hypothetical protein
MVDVTDFLADVDQDFHRSAARISTLPAREHRRRSPTKSPGRRRGSEFAGDGKLVLGDYGPPHL